MCGIAGYLSKGSEDQPVGSLLLDMLGGLARRGPDSAGVALFRSRPAGHLVVWVRLPVSLEPSTAESLVLARLQGIAEVARLDPHPGLLRLELATDGSRASDVSRALERPGEDIEVVSAGEYLELVKQVGTPDGLDGSFAIRNALGSHGIGHTRLSTESRVDLSHSQPFWAHGVADLATVHNGHITNYHRLRRHYEQSGVRFFTGNDSEIIGVYLADQLARGRSLEQAVANSLDDLDGSFTYLVATPDAIGYARDPFALKPLVIVETADAVAIANEEVAIRRVLGSDGVAREPTGHVFHLWRRRPSAVGAAA